MWKQIFYNINHNYALRRQKFIMMENKLSGIKKPNRFALPKTLVIYITQIMKKHFAAK